VRKAACIDLRNFITNSWDIAHTRVSSFVLTQRFSRKDKT